MVEVICLASIGRGFCGLMASLPGDAGTLRLLKNHNAAREEPPLPIAYCLLFTAVT